MIVLRVRNVEFKEFAFHTANTAGMTHRFAVLVGWFACNEVDDLCGFALVELSIVRVFNEPATVSADEWFHRIPLSFVVRNR
jgi:hypothetical protein